MRKWSYAVNSYYKTASIEIDILPKHLYYLEKIAEYFCCIRILRWIKFPSFIHITDKDDGSVYTLKEWWGNLGGWFHCTIHNPIFNYVYNQNRCKGFALAVDYEKLKDLFKDIDKEYWDRIAESEKEYEKEREI